MNSPENAVRELLESWAKNVHDKDWNALRELYSADVVLFDVIPPLLFSGADVETGFVDWFDWYDGPINYERTSITVEVDRQLAVYRSVDRVSGTLRTGANTDYWLRHTVVLRDTGDGWRIAHQHASVPVYLPAGDTAGGTVPHVTP